MARWDGHDRNERKVWRGGKQFSEPQSIPLFTGGQDQAFPLHIVQYKPLNEPAPSVTGGGSTVIHVHTITTWPTKRGKRLLHFSPPARTHVANCCQKTTTAGVFPPHVNGKQATGKGNKENLDSRSEHAHRLDKYEKREMTSAAGGKEEKRPQDRHAFTTNRFLEKTHMALHAWLHGCTCEK